MNYAIIYIIGNKSINRIDMIDDGLRVHSGLLGDGITLGQVESPTIWVGWPVVNGLPHSMT